MANRIHFLHILILAGLLALLSAPDLLASGNFDHAEYMEATAAGQKKTTPAIKGTLSFNMERRSIQFFNEKGAVAFSIGYDAVKSILYEQAATPRYAAAVLVSPLFLLPNAKKHYLTIQYTNEEGDTRVVIIRLDKNAARQAVATAEAKTGHKVDQVEQK